MGKCPSPSSPKRLRPQDWGLHGEARALSPAAVTANASVRGPGCHKAVGLPKTATAACRRAGFGRAFEHPSGCPAPGPARALVTAEPAGGSQGPWCHCPQPCHCDTSLSVKYAHMWGKQSGRICSSVPPDVNSSCLHFLTLL